MSTLFLCGGERLRNWIAVAVGKMHVNKVLHKDVASRMGVTEEYLSMILNGKKTPKGASERILTAIDEIIAERK
jgi:transcriptional regulator with XRE-family HTH domain